jgi:hypothetical protein
VLPALAQLAETDGEDRWMQTAILSSVAERSGQLAEVLVQSTSKQTTPVLRALGEIVGARRQQKELIQLLQLTLDQQGERAREVRSTLLSGLVEGLRLSQANKPVLTGGQEMLERLVQTSSGAVQRKALQVAGLIQLRESAGIRKLREAAIEIALEDEKPLEERQASLAALEGATTAELAPLLRLLDARQPLDIQLAAVRLFASCDGPEVVQLLLKNWQNYTPRMQTFILDAICGRQDRLPLLLDAVEKKTVDAAALPALRQTQLLENPDATIRRRAKVLLAARINDDHKQVLGKYQAALTLPRDIR